MFQAVSDDSSMGHHGKPGWMKALDVSLKTVAPSSYSSIHSIEQIQTSPGSPTLEFYIQIWTHLLYFRLISE